MKFLIDAQLPARLAEFLNQVGHDAVHTLGLPHRNRSTDREIAERADADDRVLVTKDRDFRDGHLLARTPRRLLVVATGNITNNDLCPPSNSTSRPSSRDFRRPTSPSCPRTL